MGWCLYDSGWAVGLSIVLFVVVVIALGFPALVLMLWLIVLF